MSAAKAVTSRLPSGASRSASADADADRDAADAAGALFHADQFIEQLLVQLLVPISVLYLVIAHSCSAAANVLSVPRPFECIFAVIFALAQLISMMPITVLVAWCMRGPADLDQDAGTAVLRVDMVAIAAILMMHRLAIAIKYAFQPRALYARRMSQWVTHQERLDDQLFASWFKLTRVTIEREVVAAAATLAEDEAAAAFDLPFASFARLRDSLHEEAQQHLVGCAPASAAIARVQAPALATALLSHVNEVTSWQVLALQRATTLAGLVSMFSTTILRASQGLPVLGATSLETCIIISAWISNLLLLPTVFTFLSVGIVDHARRERALEVLSRLCRPSSLRQGGLSASASSTSLGSSSGSASGSGSSRGASGSGSSRGLSSASGSSMVGILAQDVQAPVLPLEAVSDVRAFLAVRSLLLAFGAGFHSRLVTVISADLIVTLAVAAFCVYTTLTVTLAQSVTALYAPLVLYHALVVPALALCALGLVLAARANTAAASGANVLAQARLLARLAAGRAASASASASSLASREGSAELIALLDDVERLLRDNVAPVTVLGVAATPALANALMGGIASVETVLVSGAATRLSANAPAGGGAPAPAASGLPSPSPSAAAGSSSSLSPSPGPLAGGGGDAARAQEGGFDLQSALQVGYFFAALLAATVAAALLVVCARRCSRGGGQGSAAAPQHTFDAGKAAGAALVNPLVAAGRSAGAGAGAGATSGASPVPAASPAAAANRYPWVRRTDLSGDQWWENLKTGETAWDLPANVE